ncbi:Tos2p KNAG_0A01640 [Huiozyma naganishii CBS 8797]|uniref:Uncharacterized protein n=1 Tax=Huiozyma naganishii (strain ATCC MYA-139 / BCRC 22969 / CBS 8797 / KCTC 17520 / NBRC 10181 / NCYC 3082 / Yp74L-3) TaxID=1071383 RepID=J7RE69_HUIN7|nr:hypothetical protein KNAG_0A01640 [Kazachstania naganishii CBS 8797]CCK67853.1 hypothetical protein KNAG_0A01640 [Kazachstania naganishii CBS 8797]
MLTSANELSLVVGCAVGVPVFIVLCVVSGMFWFSYKRSLCAEGRQCHMILDPISTISASELKKTRSDTTSISSSHDTTRVDSVADGGPEDEDVKRLRSIYDVYFESSKSTLFEDPADEDDDDDETPIPSPITMASTPPPIGNTKPERLQYGVPITAEALDVPQRAHTVRQPRPTLPRITVQDQISRAHPQTLENMQALPSASELNSSPSVMSFTAFKKDPWKYRQQQQQQQQQNRPMSPGMMPLYNQGMFVCPINDPTMFYTNTIKDQSPTNGAFTLASNEPLLPHHLRQSVVMINPHDLTRQRTYKPAGSFRKGRKYLPPTAQNLTVEHRAEMRVSGLLDDNDTVQPLSVGEILPMKSKPKQFANNDDDLLLRKQLGTSNNYQIFL